MKIFLSGLENKSHFNLVRDIQYPYMLMSFLFLRRKRRTLEQYLNECAFPVELMIDSGAFSFMSRGVAKSIGIDRPTRSDLDRFVDEYLEFLLQYKDYISLAVEFDIQIAYWNVGNSDKNFASLSRDDTQVGVDYVSHLREDIFKPFIEENNIPICFVSHGEDLETLIPYGTYLGISGDYILGAPRIRKSLSRAETDAVRLGLKLHGFAITGRRIRRYHFDSVDSTTWLDGTKFGISFHLQGGTLRLLTADAGYRRKRYARQCRERGVDLQEFVNGKGSALNKYNVYEWKLFAEYMKKRWERAGRG